MFCQAQAQNPFSTEVFHFTLGNEHNDWVCVALWGGGKRKKEPRDVKIEKEQEMGE